MRFRLATPADIPDCTRLYQAYLDGHGPYPQTGDEPLKDFATVLLYQMLQSPQTFTVVGVVSSTIDSDGVVHGGRAKAMSICYVAERPLGRPSPRGFCELLVVDPKFQGKKIGRMLVQVIAREMVRRGALVLECGYAPGSLAEQLWTQMGCEPYSVQASWTLNGVPREGLPLIPSGIRTALPKPED